MKISMLHYVKQGKDFVLDIDVSQYAVGAVLNQFDENGQVIPLAFASKTCKTHQQYCATKLACCTLWYTSCCISRSPGLRTWW